MSTTTEIGDWSKHKGANGSEYYHNKVTKVSQYEKPAEWIEVKPEALPPPPPPPPQSSMMLMMQPPPMYPVQPAYPPFGMGPQPLMSFPQPPPGFMGGYPPQMPHAYSHPPPALSPMMGFQPPHFNPGMPMNSMCDMPRQGSFQYRNSSGDGYRQQYPRRKDSCWRRGNRGGGPNRQFQSYDRNRYGRNEGSSNYQNYNRRDSNNNNGERDRLSSRNYRHRRSPTPDRTRSQTRSRSRSFSRSRSRTRSPTPEVRHPTRESSEVREHVETAAPEVVKPEEVVAAAVVVKEEEKTVNVVPEVDEWMTEIKVEKKEPTDWNKYYDPVLAKAKREALLLDIDADLRESAEESRRMEQMLADKLAELEAASRVVAEYDHKVRICRDEIHNARAVQKTLKARMFMRD